MDTETLKTSDLVFTRVFNAPVETVWQAWSNPEYVQQWWGPNGFTCPSASIDFRVGGTSLLCMNAPEYGDLYNTFQYREIIPTKQIKFISNLADKDGKKIDPASIGMPADFPQELFYILSFEDLGNRKTKLTVIELDWPHGQMMEMSRMGMEQCLDKMAAIFAKH